MSENLSATMLIPSNDVVNNALSVARKNLENWNMTRADSILETGYFNRLSLIRSMTKPILKAMRI